MPRRFWIEFERAPGQVATALHSFGVTAPSRDAALALIRERAYCGKVPLPVAKIVEDVDVSTLDPNHVLPNMEPPHETGIWFPMGFRDAFAPDDPD
ncbi:hypothetical protein P2H44_12100 [Albimonas sp. CAU 1670]|uniref:hypothetical protein n=1 Tax=Albimonas sp. CAU 1670 TaxID=3032599 RepID=UPI0023DA37D3|nr:hypothetical protein [Albimonas sp. CAU 1670]MDF2233295.1 hypothetical protein [Albimonas sp. CAU 1670]